MHQEEFLQEQPLAHGNRDSSGRFHCASLCIRELDGGRMSTGRDCLMLFYIQSCPWSQSVLWVAQPIYKFLMLELSLKREQVEILCLSMPVKAL